MGIVIVNSSTRRIEVFVTKYFCSDKDVSDHWCALEPGARDTWNRETGWEIIGFRAQDDYNQRVAVYAAGGAVVTFKSFDSKLAGIDVL